jgi:hypothetical protein
MTSDELAAWRKEQRRERNRQSAKASREQTKARIAELEGEVSKYKTQCEEMKLKMDAMERQLQDLIKLSTKQFEEPVLRITSPVEHLTVTPLGSSPSSPARSAQEPSPQDDFHNPAFPDFAPSYPLMFNPHQSSVSHHLSIPADRVPIQVTNDDAAATVKDSFLDYVPSSAFQSKEHLIKPISRQA